MDRSLDLAVADYPLAGAKMPPNVRIDQRDHGLRCRDTIDKRHDDQAAKSLFRIYDRCRNWNHLVTGWRRGFEKGVVYLLPCKLSTLAFINLIRSRSKKEQEW